MNIGGALQLVAVHHGECTIGWPRLQPVARQGAIEALTAGVEACTLCRPDWELRIGWAAGAGMRTTAGGLRRWARGSTVTTPAPTTKPLICSPKKVGRCATCQQPCHHYGHGCTHCAPCAVPRSKPGGPRRRPPRSCRLPRTTHLTAAHRRGSPQGRPMH
ncbi:DUF6233 domain-containing protein [Streptomyces kronopolitis]